MKCLLPHSWLSYLSGKRMTLKNIDSTKRAMTPKLLTGLLQIIDLMYGKGNYPL